MSSQLLLNQAVSLHRAGRLSEAERLYGQVLAAERANFPAWYLLASLLYQQQRPAEALAAVDEALTLNPGAAEALGLKNVLMAETQYRQGNELVKLGRWDEAIVLYDHVLARTPAASGAWSNRGLALYELERFADSLDSYDKALALRPDHAPAWTNRGKALNNLQRFDEALASYDKALALAPGSVETWHARAHTLRTMYKYDEALACLDKARALRPEMTDLEFTCGWVVCEQGKIAEGLAIIRDAAARTVDEPGPAHKQRHDAEQRDYIGAAASTGIHYAGGEALPGPVINPANAEAATKQWEISKPQIVVIDNFLAPEALEALRTFCWGSTVWRKPYPNGYLGAFPEQGFAAPLLAQIAEGLRDTFPGIIGDHRLRMLWGFKYDSSLRGIEIHADQAAVNVNFWITPDAANTNPESGGMVIWDVAAPEDWGAKRYNGDDALAREFLLRTGAKRRTVPHRANRAVIFDSDLFHKTDEIDFQEGYLNRRINLTLLYGRRTLYGV